MKNLLVLLAVLITVSFAQADILTDNGVASGFESYFINEWEEKIPLGFSNWTPNWGAPGISHGVITEDPAGAHGGSFYWYLNGPDNGNPLVGTVYVTQGDGIDAAVNPGDSITFGAWVKNDAEDPADFMEFGFDRFGPTPWGWGWQDNLGLVSIDTLTTEWQYFEVTAEVPAGCDVVSPKVATFGGTIYTDDWTMAMAPAVDDKTLFVDADAPGSNNGSSWYNAFNHLQDAISLAANGNSIWVAEGTYKPDQGSYQTPGDRNASFALKYGVQIKGGFAGYGNPDPNENDPELYPVFLSGDLDGDDGPDFMDNNENSYHVVTGSYITASASLDGFIITGGNANGPEWSSRSNGGGIYNESASPTIKNCIFTKNLAMIFGGGMWNTNGSNPTLIDCAFNENVAYHCGGGMSNETSSSPIVNNCEFNSNWSDLRGGGMYNWIFCSPILTGCSFTENTSSEGGGLSNWDHSSPIVTNCWFSNNWAGNRGGGIDSWISSNIVLSNCRLNNNFSGWSGGGMFSSESIPTVTNCTFTNNRAAHWGGGMYNRFSNATVANCTFLFNSANEYGGGGISNFLNSRLEVLNGILWDNYSKTGGQIHKDGTSMVEVTYSDVQGGWPGIGNIDSDPLFVNPNSNDYHLLPDSPCINSGDPSYEPLPGETDLDGMPRVIGPVIDMGAYEYNHPPIADAGEDQTVYAFVDGLAEVLLDGSGSYDPEGSSLECFWYNDANNLIATGAEANVILPSGKHVITLIVCDGLVDSEAETVVINVIGPIEAAMKLTPRTLNCRSRGRWVKAHIILPAEYAVSGIDINQPVVVHPYGIESASLEVIVNDQERVEITAAFDREVICSLLGNWPEVFTVYSFFPDGCIFYGQSGVRINPAGLKEIEVLAEFWLQAGCGPPEWCDGLDLNRDTMVDLQDYPLLLSSEVEFIVK